MIVGAEVLTLTHRLTRTRLFGTGQNLSTAVILTRMGSDLQVSLAVTYNALQNNFGVNLEVLPNVVASRPRASRVPGVYSGVWNR